jgi:hypothetical protein
MIDHNILWSRAIGFDGRIVKEPTVFGAALIGLAFFAGLALLIFLFAFL